MVTSHIGAESGVLKALASDLLNSLTANIAVVDANGTIVAANERWQLFARENGGDDEGCYVGESYLSVCEDAIRRDGDETAEAVRDALLALARGEREHFSLEYTCHSPDERRWYKVNLSRFSHQAATYLVTAHENITARRLATDKLREAEETLRKVLEALPVGVWIMDRTGLIVHGNSAGFRIWAGARFVGPESFGDYKGWWLDTGRRIEAEEWAAARAVQKGETSIDEEVRIEAFDGASKIILNSAIPLRDADGEIAGAIIVNQDITARKLREEELKQANAAVDRMNRALQEILERERKDARTDDLTGLNNRRRFFERSEQLFEVARRYRTPFSIVVFDIDHFKRINDLFGHQVGDAVLTEIAEVVRHRTRETDVLARYGGEEFIIALPNTGAEGALAVAEDLRESVARWRKVTEAGEVSVTISAGVAEILPDEKNLDRLIHRADQALYEAKAAGRNCTRRAPGGSGPRGEKGSPAPSSPRGGRRRPDR